MGFICGTQSDPRITHDENSNCKKSWKVRLELRVRRINSLYRITF